MTRKFLCCITMMSIILLSVLIACTPNGTSVELTPENPTNSSALQDIQSTQHLDSASPSDNSTATNSTATPIISTSPVTPSETSQILETPEPHITSDIMLGAKKALLYDMKSDCVLHIKGSLHDHVYPASITKLYTAYVALKYLSPDEIITAGDELELLQPGSSIAFIRKGHRLSVEMLIEGMLLPSGNDAAYVLAAAAGRTIAGDSSMLPQNAVFEFVNELNRQAINDGLLNTHFVNPDGYHDDQHYTTLYDIIIIARLSLNQELISQYTSLYTDKVYYAGGQNITWVNTNKLLDPNSHFYRDEVIGLKTGYTDEAGYCLLTAADYNDKRIIVAVFNCESSDIRFQDTITLLDIIKN